MTLTNTVRDEDINDMPNYIIRRNSGKYGLKSYKITSLDSLKNEIIIVDNQGLQDQNCETHQMSIANIIRHMYQIKYPKK